MLLSILVFIAAIIVEIIVINYDCSIPSKPTNVKHYCPGNI